MRHRVAVLVAADAIEAKIGHMVLAAGIEAAADLDAQAADGLIHLGVLCGQAHAQFSGEAARGSDAELAGIGAGAGGNVDDRVRNRRGQIGVLQIRVESGRSASLTQRSTRFCSTVLRTVSFMYLREMSATARSCVAVMSPSGSAIVTVA